MITKAGINDPKWQSGRWRMEDISIIIIGEDGVSRIKVMGSRADKAIK